MDFYSEIDIIKSELQFDGIKVKDGHITYVRSNYELNEILNPINGQLAVTQHDYKLNYYNGTSWDKVKLPTTYDKRTFLHLIDDTVLQSDSAEKIITNQGATKNIILIMDQTIIQSNYRFTFISVAPYKITIKFFPSFRIDKHYNTLETNDNASSFETIRIISCNQIGHWSILSESNTNVYTKSLRDLSLDPGNTAVYTSINRTTSTVVNNLEHINISSTGNGNEFGDLGLQLECSVGGSNGSLGTAIYAGAFNPNISVSNIIQYFKFISGSQGDTFCNCSQSKYSRTFCDTGNRNRGVFAGGWDNTSVMEYIRTNLPGGNAFNFGNLTKTRGMATAASNDVYERGSCHTDYSNVDGSEYWNMMNASTCVQFGSLLYPWSYAGATSNGILNRVIRSGGYGSRTHIVYFNLLSLSDALLFGNLMLNRDYHDMVSNKVNNRAIIVGGSQRRTTIEYININSLGDALLFGNIIKQQTNANWSAASSNS